MYSRDNCRFADKLFKSSCIIACFTSTGAIFFKKLLDLKLHNKTIIGFGFHMIAKLLRLWFVLPAAALIIIAIMLNYIQYR